MDLGYPPHHYESARPGYRGTSLQEFHALFPDEASCLQHIFKVRFGEQPPCPKCSKPGRWYLMRAARRFQHPCGQSLSPTAGSIFHKTRISLRLWLYAILHFSNSAEGVNSLFLARHLGICNKASFGMARAIRLNLAAIDQGQRIGRPGEPVLVLLDRVRCVRASVSGAPRGANIFLISDAASVQATVITRRRQHLLRRIITDKTVEGVIPITNCYLTYRALSEFGTRRPAVEFVPSYGGADEPDCDLNKGFLTYARTPLRHHYRRVDHSHLWTYLKEFEFRFNRRHRSQEIFRDAISEFPDLNAVSQSGLQAWNSRILS